MKLVITEKPSVGASISKVLGAATKKGGYYEGGGYIVSWCVGHLVGLADADKYDEKYTKWDSSHLPIIPEVMKFTINKKTQPQFNIIKQLMGRKDVNEVICATDAGREGELIFRLVYDKAGCKKPIKRLWISSMEDSAIRTGFDNLKDGKEYDPLFGAAISRAKADWLVGINATRLYSATYGCMLNIGRVITPTLAMIVARNEKITKHIKEKYYIARLDMGGYEALSDHIKEQTEAESIKNICSNKNAICQKIKKEKKTISPPKLFDLTSLQREANRLFGYTAQETLDIAQKLYEAKLITYPRTDSNYLTSDMEGGLLGLVDLAAYMLDEMYVEPEYNTSQVINDSKVTDHHAIIITERALSGIGELIEKEKNILKLVSNRMICAVSKKHIFESEVAEFDCEGHKFTAKGKKTLQEGWKLYEHEFVSSIKKAAEDKKDKDDDEKALPEIIEESSHKVQSTKVTEHETQPPKHYTENTLLSAMENAGKEEMTDETERKGIGTPATRAGVIETLIKRKFVERKGKQLIPSKLGTTLISIVPDTLKTPLLTAEWENRLAQIAKGKESADKFISDIEDFVRDIVKNISVSESGKSGFVQASASKEIIGKCINCGGNVVEMSKSYSCEKKCGLIIWKENRFLLNAKKKLTKAMVQKLLKEGNVEIAGLTSKAGKKYDCTIAVDNTGKVSPVFN